jgi:tetratricopeptide (TPR) repeat protein
MERLGPEAERYLRAVVEGHPIWVRSELVAELRGHLVEAIQRRVSQDADTATAEREALAAFGPAEELHRELARVPRPGVRSGGSLPGALLDWWRRLPLDWLAPLKLLRGRPPGNFQRDYHLGRFDAIIARGEHELRSLGPRLNLHHELGMAYNAIGEYERALGHLEAKVEWLRRHPLPRLFGGTFALATAYSNLAGVLERLGRLDESDAAVAAGLAADPQHGFLHMQRARRRAARGDREAALRDLRALFEDRRMQSRAQFLLFVTRDPTFDPLRDDAGFHRLLLRAAAA